VAAPGVSTPEQDTVHPSVVQEEATEQKPAIHIVPEPEKPAGRSDLFKVLAVVMGIVAVTGMKE